jgi:hypothetical protein
LPEPGEQLRHDRAPGARGGVRDARSEEVVERRAVLDQQPQEPQRRNHLRIN